MSRYKLIDWRHGKMLINPRDMYIGRALDLYGEFAQDEFDHLEDLMRPEFVVVDCGANIGTHSLWFARRAAFVFSFEPQRLIFQMLCANMALNDVDNVVTFHAAVGDRARAITVAYLDPDVDQNFAGLQLRDDVEGEPVRMMSIDSLGLPRCDLIKMDVEGCEVQALAGARETIMRHRPYLYVEDDKEDQREELHASLRALGYVFQLHHSALYRSGNFFHKVENVFGRTANSNLICVPEESVEARGEDAA